jgi:hypothetical protein
MILNLSYIFLYNKNDKDILNMILMNTKIYVISISFYMVLYYIISLLNNKTLMKILYIVLLTDIISLIINILQNVLPDDYLIINNIKKKLSLYKE